MYVTDNFNPVKTWNGLTTSLQNAGIEGPSLAIGTPTTAAGGLTNGDHLIRYRYKDTTSGYVSNPSPALTYTVSGSNGLLTFGIGASDDIRTTSDPKVDQYVIEATPIGGGTFYQLGTAAVGATSVQVGMADSSLIQQFNSDSEYGSGLDTYSNDVPPLGTICIPHRGRLWILGDAAVSLTDVTFTNGSATVTALAGFSTAWDDGAAFLIIKTGDSVAYEISAVASGTSLTLSANYAGSTSTTTARVFKRFPNRGYYSGLFYPEGFYLAVQARDFLAETSDTLTSGIGRKDGLYVFGLTNAERLIYNSDPSAGAGAVISPLRGRRGNWNQRTLVDVDGNLYAWDRSGIWIVGEVPRPISGPIDDIIELYCDFTANAKFHACYSPISRIVMFFYVQIDDTEPKVAACYEVDTGRWFLHTFLQGMTASQQVATDDGQVRMMLGDENGYSWYYDIPSTFDGTPPDNTAVLTVTSASGTSIVVNETLTTTAPALAGVMLYQVSSGESRYIASNTADTITLGSAFTADPVADDVLYLGPIPIEYRTKWWVGPGQENRKSPAYFVMKLFPGMDSGRLRVYFYADFATSPSRITTFTADTWPDGIQTPANGQYYIEADLDGGSGDGVLSIPVPVEWNHALQARVTSNKPDGEFRMLDMGFALTRKGIINDTGN